jgi:hypothetical protein
MVAGGLFLSCPQLGLVQDVALVFHRQSQHLLSDPCCLQSSLCFPGLEVAADDPYLPYQRVWKGDFLILANLASAFSGLRDWNRGRRYVPLAETGLVYSDWHCRHRWRGPNPVETGRVSSFRSVLSRHPGADLG